MNFLPLALGLAAMLAAAPGLAQYPENPDDAAAESAARAAIQRMGPERVGIALVFPDALSVAGEVAAIVGVRSGLTAEITPLEAAMDALDARVTDTLIEVALSSDVLFDFDSDQLKPAAETALNDLKTLISEAEVLAVSIVGHTDARGSETYNMDLSQRRAASVRDWLTAAGLAAGLFTVEGRGETEPVAPNEQEDGSDNPEGRALNRRVEILIRTRRPIT